MAELSVDTAPDGVVTLALGGRLDIEGAQAVELRIAGHTAVNDGAFILDLSGVSFLASIGIRTLLATAKAVRSRGGRLVLLGPDPNVSQTLRVAGIDRLIPMFDDAAAARAALTTPGS